MDYMFCFTGNKFFNFLNIICFLRIIWIICFALLETSSLISLTSVFKKSTICYATDH